jgi:hypothetical protein
MALSLIRALLLARGALLPLIRVPPLDVDGVVSENLAPLASIHPQQSEKRAPERWM